MAEKTAPITADRVRYAMMIHDISGTDLARALDIHKSVLSRILRGHDARAPKTLPAIYEAVLLEAQRKALAARSTPGDRVRSADVTLADLDEDPDAPGQDP